MKQRLIDANALHYQTGPCSFSGRCHACGVRNDIPPVERAYYCPCCGAKMED